MASLPDDRSAGLPGGQLEAARGNLEAFKVYGVAPCVIAFGIVFAVLAMAWRIDEPARWTTTDLVASLIFSGFQILVGCGLEAFSRQPRRTQPPEELPAAVQEVNPLGPTRAAS